MRANDVDPDADDEIHRTGGVAAKQSIFRMDLACQS